RVQAAAFACGWLALVVALVSPLDALSGALFAAHMVQHELLIVVAAPLVVLGAPAIALMWLLPPSPRKSVFEAIRRPAVLAAWAAITAPATAWLLHAVALWIWHLPELYEAALEDGYMHAAQHISFFGTAGLLMWVPAGAIFVIVGVWFVAAWLRESARRVRLTGVASALLISFLFVQRVACSR